MKILEKKAKKKKKNYLLKKKIKRYFTKKLTKPYKSCEYMGRDS